MKIGFLHITTTAHKNSGVLRYGKMLAKETRAQGLAVLEAEHLLESNQFDKNKLIAPLKPLEEIDLLHLQYNPKCWGRTYCHQVIAEVIRQFENIPIVINLHDVYFKDYPRSLLLSAILQPAARLATRFGITTEDNSFNYIVSNHHAYKQIREQVKQCLVFDQYDASKIGLPNTTIIPHFVESPPARNAQSSSDKRVVGFLGFAGWRKGIDIFLRSMKFLDENYEFVVIGGQEKEEFIKAHYEDYGPYLSNGKLSATGYLSDDDLTQAIYGVDLAVCPFRTLSASGSLSTWIAHEIPILAHALDKIKTYNQIESGAIAMYKPNRPEKLAEEIKRYFDLEERDQLKSRIRELKNKLSLKTIVAQHISVYKKVLAHDH